MNLESEVHKKHERVHVISNENLSDAALAKMLTHQSPDMNLVDISGLNEPDRYPAPKTAKPDPQHEFANQSEKAKPKSFMDNAKFFGEGFVTGFAYNPINLGIDAANAGLDNQKHFYSFADKAELEKSTSGLAGEFTGSIAAATIASFAFLKAPKALRETASSVFVYGNFGAMAAHRFNWYPAEQLRESTK